MTGSTMKEALCNSSTASAASSTDTVKSKYQHKFDVVFVSSRVAQVVSESYFPMLLRSQKDGNKDSVASTDKKSVVCMESSKYLVPLSKQEKKLFDSKIVEYATGNNSSPAPPNKSSKVAKDPVASNSSTEAPEYKNRFHQLTGKEYPITRKKRDAQDDVVDVLFFLA